MYEDGEPEDLLRSAYRLTGDSHVQPRRVEGTRRLWTYRRSAGLLYGMPGAEGDATFDSVALNVPSWPPSCIDNWYYDAECRSQAAVARRSLVYPVPHSSKGLSMISAKYQNMHR